MHENICKSVYPLANTQRRTLKYKNTFWRIFCCLSLTAILSLWWIIWSRTMQRQWKSYWTVLEFDTFTFHRIVLTWIPLKSSGQKWRFSCINSRWGLWILFRMRSNILFRLFRLLTAQGGSVPAAIRFIFENRYKLYYRSWLLSMFLNDKLVSLF